ncbi:hypothetical protein N431DRAFT_218912 [Stipitochalara longipes BDJ]|nr:hypothetical protein N431DRAFT_218912 [Stipitochalara longipes BDJ]
MSPHVQKVMRMMSREGSSKASRQAPCMQALAPRSTRLNMGGLCARLPHGLSFFAHRPTNNHIHPS